MLQHKSNKRDDVEKRQIVAVRCPRDRDVGTSHVFKGNNDTVLLSDSTCSDQM